VNIEQALARSTSHTEIVSCTGTREEIDGLCAEADGSTDLVNQYGYVDVWGTDDDGVEYRLHITPYRDNYDPTPLCRCGTCTPGNVTCTGCE
jgi:hypothetical protein